MDPFFLFFRLIYQSRGLAFNWGVWPGSVAILPEPEGSDVVKTGGRIVPARGFEPFYLLDRCKTRLITSQETMDKYGFSEASAVIVPQILVDALPDGEIWE